MLKPIHIHIPRTYTHRSLVSVSIGMFLGLFVISPVNKQDLSDEVSDYLDPLAEKDISSIPNNNNNNKHEHMGIINKLLNFYKDIQSQMDMVVLCYNYLIEKHLCIFFFILCFIYLFIYLFLLFNRLDWLSHQNSYQHLLYGG